MTAASCETEMDKSGASPGSVNHTNPGGTDVFLAVNQPSDVDGTRRRSSSPLEPPRSPYRRAKSLTRAITVETQHVTREETEVYHEGDVTRVSR